MTPPIDGPVTKPQREPVEKPEPRPKGPSGPVNQPAPPRPAPRPAPPPVEGPIDRGPVVKPRPEPVDPAPPTTLSGPIGERWRRLGGLSWGRPLGEPESVSGGRIAHFELPSGQFAAIVWSRRTGALLVGPAMTKAYGSQGFTRGSLGFPTAEEIPTHDQVGRFQTFGGGLIVWHPRIGRGFAVVGAINVTYLSAGGTGYGYPIADQAPTPDGRAWVQEFRELETGAEGSIYWTPEHGAHPLFGAIRAAWRSYRGEASLGHPKTGEMAINDGGRWQRFENADYIWHPDTGAHEVHGAIAALYHQLGGSKWGYPTTDETKAADGVGRLNHFRNVASGHDLSIFWTSDTGAQPVYGLILQGWAFLGWERSYLGYPKEPEKDWPEGGSGSRQQLFQKGRMLYRADLNLAGPDPIDLFHDFGKGHELRGWVRVRIHSDGRVEHSGHQRATGASSWSFGIQVSVTNGPEGVANAWEGKCHGTFESGPRNDDWYEDSASGAVASAFWDLQQSARLEVERHKDRSLGWVSGVLESGLKFFLGSGAGVILGPAGATLIVVGTLAGAAVSGGNVQAGLRIVNGTLWMAGPGGTFIALVAEGIAQLATQDRPLRDDEWEIAELVFKSQLPPRDDIRITNAVGGGNRPFVFKRFDGKFTINMGEWEDDPLAMKVGFHRDGDDPSKGTIIRGEKLVEDWFGGHYTPGVSNDKFGLDSAAAKGDDLYGYIADSIRSGTGSAV